MDTGAALGGAGLFISIIGIIYSAINHKHIRANCCGRKLEFSLDINSTSNKNIDTKSDNTDEDDKSDENINKILGNKLKIHPFNS